MIAACFTATNGARSRSEAGTKRKPVKKRLKLITKTTQDQKILKKAQTTLWVMFRYEAGSGESINPSGAGAGKESIPVSAVTTSVNKATCMVRSAR